ncbi:MAG: aminomethyl transferase family protein [Alphaproteobacteria bacterium]|nr:MAG: aminomethyl transferase family protein [Alphaproteobacteria bacterium]
MSQVIDKEHYRQYVWPTPFHERTSQENKMSVWSVWNGYTVSRSMENTTYEYFAIRNSCSVLDISPMSKFRVRGPDALPYLERLMARNVSKIKERRVGYTVWCNDKGEVVEDGTLFHLGPNEYRICTQAHQRDWLQMATLGFDVEVAEETAEIAALSVQGPTSCEVLKRLRLDGIENLKPFGIEFFTFNGVKLMVSRTGYTGDLGYELWIEKEQALSLWDRLMDAGKDHGIRPIGLNALEIVRIEAGFIEAHAEYSPALETVRNGHARNPFELDLDWLIDLEKPNFTGRKALLQIKAKGPKRKLVKLDIEGNKPAEHSYIFFSKSGRKIGNTTSAVWSPTLKANIALATVDARYANPGEKLWVEIYFQRELQWHRAMVRATVLENAPWNPARRRATPPDPF